MSPLSRPPNEATFQGMVPSALGLHPSGVEDAPGDDVFVLITEIGRANVSFGRGLGPAGSDLSVGR